MDLDRLKALAQAATPGPWHWVDIETDLPCDPDNPCIDEEDFWHEYSLRTVEEFPTYSVGPLPKFIIYQAEEFHEVETDKGWAHPDVDYIAAVSPEVVLELIAMIEGGS
jgi:hypothetical protein